MFPDFEEAIVGMRPGDSKTVKIQSDGAFGPYHKELVTTMDRSQFPPDLEPKVGQRLNATRADGKIVGVTVIDMTERSVTLDANHALAGQDLIFDVELIEIV